MTPKNIQQFDTYTCQVLSHLYEKFPIGEDIEVYKFAKDDDLMFSETLLWLKDEGFIACEKPEKRTMWGEAYPLFSCVRLTSKGLKALRKQVSIVSKAENKTIGEEMLEAAKEGIKSKSADLVCMLLGLAI